MTKFTDTDIATLLSQPGYFYHRVFGSSDAWTKSVFVNGSNYAPAVDKTDIVFEDVGDVQTQVADETAELTLSSGRVLDPDFIVALSGGLYSRENVAGTLVSGESQTVESGSYEYDKIVMVANQNGDLTEPTINTVTAGTDGVLVLNTDYIMVQVADAGWGIAFKAGGAITTILQDMVIDYDYTPNEQVILKRGGVKIMDYLELAFQTTDENGDYVQVIFYKCKSSGADGHGFSPEKSADPVTMSLSFTAVKDTNRADDDQLFRKVFGGVSL